MSTSTSSSNASAHFEEQMRERVRNAVLSCTPADTAVHVHCTLVVKILKSESQDNASSVLTVALNETISEKDRQRLLHPQSVSASSSHALPSVPLPSSNTPSHLLTSLLGSIFGSNSGNGNGVLPTGPPPGPPSSSSNGFSTFPTSSQTPFPQLPFSPAQLFHHAELLNCVLNDNKPPASQAPTSMPPPVSVSSAASENHLLNNLVSTALGFSITQPPVPTTAAGHQNHHQQGGNQFPLNFSLPVAPPVPSSTHNVSCNISNGHLPHSVTADAIMKSLMQGVGRAANAEPSESATNGTSSADSSTAVKKAASITTSSDMSTDQHGLSSSKRRKTNKPIRLPHEVESGNMSTNVQAPSASTPALSEASSKTTDHISAFIDSVASGATSSVGWPNLSTEQTASSSTSSVDEVIRRLNASTNYLHSLNSLGMQGFFDYSSKSALPSFPNRKRKVLGAGKPSSNEATSIETPSSSISATELASSNNVPPLAVPPRKVSSNKTFRCNQCKNMFPSLNSLCEHTFEAHGSFRCTVCDSKFTQRSNLQRHALKHVGFKPFECMVCKKAYYRKDHSIRHVEVTHPNCDPKGSIQCHLTSSQCLEYLEDMEKSGLLVSVKRSKSKANNVNNNNNNADTGSSPSSHLEKVMGIAGEEEFDDLEDEMLMDEEDEFDDGEVLEEEPIGADPSSSLAEVHAQKDISADTKGPLSSLVTGPSSFLSPAEILPITDPQETDDYSSQPRNLVVDEEASLVSSSVFS